MVTAYAFASEEGSLKAVIYAVAVKSLGSNPYPSRKIAFSEENDPDMSITKGKTQIKAVKMITVYAIKSNKIRSFGFRTNISPPGAALSRYKPISA